MSDTYMTECWKHGRRWSVTDACCDDAGFYATSSSHARLARLEERVAAIEGRMKGPVERLEEALDKAGL